MLSENDFGETFTIKFCKLAKCWNQQIPENVIWDFYVALGDFHSRNVG